MRPPFERALSIIASVAVPIVIVAVAIVLFFNPLWIGFEQERAGVPKLTGFTREQVQQVTGAILHDEILGPYNFDVAVGGRPVLDPLERSHMVDVANVFHALGAIALAGAVALLVTAFVGWRRRWFWEGVAAGSGALVIGVLTVGFAFALFFDQTFTLMHELFFSAGSWQFDSGTERLVQLFPEQFWSETTVAVALAALVLAVATLAAAWRRLRAEPPELIRVAA